MLRYALINGNKVLIDTNWRFNKSINAQTAFSCTIIDLLDTQFVLKGNDIKFYDGSTLIWAGIIISLEKYEEVPGVLYYDLEIASYEYILNRIKVTEAYEGQTAGYIIKDIITKYLLNDYIIAGTIQNGITFDRVVFNSTSVYDCLNTIRTSNSGYNWCVNFDKTIDFYQMQTYKSESIINNSFIHRNFRYHDDLTEYRNVQYFEGGLKHTAIQTKYKPSPKPDGVSRDFTLKYGLWMQPAIYINSVQINNSDVGINGLDTGKKWYWSYNSKTITQDTNETVLSVTDVIEVTYYGLSPIKMLYENQPLIQERQQAELNSSGRYETYFSDNTVESNAAAATYCKGLIEKYKDNQYVTLTIDYDIGDIEINKLIFIDKPLYGIYDWFLVESISIYYQNPEYVSYDVKLLSGESVGSWEQFFKQLTTVQNTINSEDVLIKFVDLSETTVHAGVYIITSTTPMYPDDTLYPRDDLYPNYTIAGIIVNLYPDWYLHPSNTLLPGDVTGGTVLHD